MKNPFLPRKAHETLKDTIDRLAREAVEARGATFAYDEARWLLQAVEEAVEQSKATTSDRPTETGSGIASTGVTPPTTEVL